MAVIDLSKDADLPGCVEAPVLLKELIQAVSPASRQPLMTMLEILGELAFFTAKTSHPTLRILALRLGLFPMSYADLKNALEAEIKREKELDEKRKKKVEQEKEKVES
jgi:hypothetical protein